MIDLTAPDTTPLAGAEPALVEFRCYYRVEMGVFGASCVLFAPDIS